ncbi:MBL fold metallo-hydrolase [Pseudothauera nasutitermitis]|uniref:MBL fold metallo-hydrolase n=1 Tax=Pseudothauera nasutitermitis TaxID=2565930 RepID=A0A4S4B268_9RHOO|nr:MBL fold metallo-hydrolase [Pseudothauera nasutitermitis]THF66636.1 MBL fold metallo-hydrolase [Pseudothauera nasutitermitis]
MLFRQLFDEDSSTLTYLLADPHTREAVLIDTVREQAGRDLALLDELGVRLVWILETHVHADHVTAAATLKQATGARTVTGRHAGAACADVMAGDGHEIVFGGEVIRVIPTPGHTPGCVTYHWRDRLFTGDALLIGGCGRTDFQGGDAGALYDSLTTRLFTLPGETLVYPAHDYQGRRVSCIAQERDTNPRLAGKTRDQFIQLMGELNLPRPRRIDEALPANLRCGRAPDPAEHHAA